MENENHKLKLDLTKMCWYMRGSVTLSEAFQTSRDDRQKISEVIKENIELVKKTKMPLL